MMRNETTLLTFLLFYGSLKNMSRPIDVIKQHKVTQSLLKGLSARQALKNAGYKDNTVKHSTGMSVVKRGIKTVLAKIQKKDITVEYVLNNLYEDRQLSLKKKDYSTVVKTDELLGKYLAMFTDRQQIDMRVLSKEEQTIIAKYTNDVNVVNDVNITNDSNDSNNTNDTNITNDTNTTNDSTATNDTIDSNET